VSSANRTGRPPAATAVEARAMFPPTVPVLDSPEPAGAARAATTTLRLHPDGRIELQREGAQDRHHGGPGPYLTHVRTDYLPRQAD
jgi:hypothetical protein